MLTYLISLNKKHTMNLNFLILHNFTEMSMTYKEFLLIILKKIQNKYVQMITNTCIYCLYQNWKFK